ncbi:hypothetical protein LBMAG48_24890 [Phycisphaerae bacterium]|jgi:hypothetical protein|nr:hypothetical protein LBMAG48_24890 [Phycisphaerae bacterium]
MPRKERSLAWNLGSFFGQIAKAITSDPAPHKPVSQEVARREMTAQTLVDTPEGPQSVTLRRTVIDEVQFPDKPTQQ